MIMATYLDYAGRDGERPERWPNLREAAARSYMGQTAVIGRRPWLVIGFDGEMYELENEFGEFMRSNKFEVLTYESENNKIVAATRSTGSPLVAGVKLASCGCLVGALDFDRDSYEWSVLTDEGGTIDMEARVTELEDADWRVSETLSYGDPELDAGRLEAEPGSYYCPECGSNSIDWGDDIAYCQDCGWHGSWDEVVTDQDRAYDHAEENPRLDPYDDHDWQYASMQKGSPYPENSDKNAPDHSPPKQDWPKKVNSIYNACMREGNGRGDTKEEKESSCAAIAWAQYKRMKKKENVGGNRELRYAKIVQEGGQFCVKSESGDKNLGCYDSKDEAVKRLRQVEHFKTQGTAALRDVYAEEGISEREDALSEPLKCPNCGSHTVEMTNSADSQFHCKSCGNTFKHEVIKNPKAPKERKGAAWQLVDSDGNPVSSGHYYNLHGDKYKIPDVIKVLDITGDHVVATVEDNPTPLKMSAEDIETNGYSFEKLPIYSNIEQHDLREAISWPDVKNEAITQLGLGDEQYPARGTIDPSPKAIRDTFEAPTQWGTQDQEFTLPTPSGGTLWVRADREGRVTGWSVPSFDGGPGQYSDRDLDRVQSMVDQARAQAVRTAPATAKTARRAFTPGEQKKLIEEKGSARNRDKLRLEDSHYTEASVEDDDLDFLF